MLAGAHKNVVSNTHEWKRTVKGSVRKHQPTTCICINYLSHNINMKLSCKQCCTQQQPVYNIPVRSVTGGVEAWLDTVDDCLVSWLVDDLEGLTAGGDFIISSSSSAAAAAAAAAGSELRDFFLALSPSSSLVYNVQNYNYNISSWLKLGPADNPQSL